MSLLPLAVLAPSPATAKKIILDTDPGSDEAMALMLALNSSELEARRMTVVRGNMTAAQDLDNVLRLASLPLRCDIPVPSGQHAPFHKLITAEFRHGEKGRANRNSRPISASSKRALLRTSSPRWSMVAPA